LSTVIKIENLGKQYRLGQIGTGTISHDLNRWWAKIRGKEDPFLKIGEANDRTTKGTSEYVWALKDIDFSVNQGEVLGIVGRNGAGKSTLLKILSRTTLPTVGSLKIKGRIASLLEVGTGFHPELSGRDNIFQNGALLGMTKKEITRKFDEIVDFSGVERYIDTPVKRYSSGMYVRLAFAVAAHLESEILIVDEVLAVGDADFQKKCLGKMSDISKIGGRTVLFVSHNMSAVKSLCTRGIVLENGKIKFDGDISDAQATYQKSNIEVDIYLAAKSSKDLYLKSAKILNVSNNISSDETISFQFEIETILTEIKNKYLLVRIMDSLNQVIFSCEVEIKIGKKVYFLQIHSKTLVKGFYKINCILYHPAVAKYDEVDNCCNFAIIDNIKAFSHLETFDIGKVYIPHKWQ
jgi:lipopolysaccharide transport system ATP-binding protein